MNFSLAAIICLNLSFQAKAEVTEVKPKVAPSFGTVFEMTGTIRHRIPNQKVKRPGPEWFIEITVVDGKLLVKPVVIEFSRPINEEKPDLKKDGLVLKIAAYELGQFAGIPKNYPKHGAPWQDVAFHFRHEIVIAKILE
ncbi:MAG: hypothetical protein ACKVJU_21150 [Verrucomicrobiales bacterium]